MIVVAGNNPFDEPASASALAAMSSATFNPQYNAVWGSLDGHAEENSALQTANVASQGIRLNLMAVLEADAGRNPSIFTVEVNGKAVAVQSVGVEAGADESTDLVLQLPEGTLEAGDSVSISWQNLVAAKGRALTGYVSMTAQ